MRQVRDGIVAVAVAAAMFSGAAKGQEQAQLDGSPALFAVMAAINAAGYDAELDSPSNHALRKQVRQAVASRKPASLARIREFFRERRQRDAGAELSQYISLALSTGPPPEFKARYEGLEAPPDVVALEPLRPMLAEFWNEAGLEELWARSQPAYDEVIAAYHEPVVNALLTSNLYLRNPTSGARGRRFQIYIDLLGAPNQVHVRSYIDDYFVVITPSAAPRVQDVRHAYLHYLLDPLCIRNQARLEPKRGLLDFSHASPILAEQYKNDFVLLAGMSLVKAVEARLDRSPAHAATAMSEGFILTGYFYDALPAYEKQELAMRLYLPGMFDAIDVSKEDKRISKVEFASKRETRMVAVEEPARPVLSAAEKTLEAAEELYRQREFQKASSAFKAVIGEGVEARLQAKAYFGLARIAALEREPELAQQLFEKTLTMTPEPYERAWANIYLARLAMASGEPVAARGYYVSALGVEGISEAARKAAEKELASMPPDKSP